MNRRPDYNGRNKKNKQKMTSEERIIMQQRALYGVHPEEKRRYTVPFKYEMEKRPSKIVTYSIRFSVFLFVTLILFAVFSLIFLLNLTASAKAKDIAYEFDFRQDKSENSKEKIQKQTAPYDVAVQNGEYYIPFNYLAEKLGFIALGEPPVEYSYEIAGTGQYIRVNTADNVIVLNDVDYHINYPAFVYNDDLYLPLEFVADNIVGIKAESENGRILISRNEEVQDVRFKILYPEHTEHLDELEIFGEIYIPVSFAADLSEYEKYFQPENRDEYIKLINQTHPIEPIDYVPDDLIDVIDTRPGIAMQKLRQYPAKALEGLLKEARAQGFSDIKVISAYRDYNYQKELYDSRTAEYIKQYGENYLDYIIPTTAMPGHSEHQSGMCLDMTNAANSSKTFGDTPEGMWLAENAHRFGFVVRYPADKIEITGIDYEPWHFRYVGKYHATQMYERKMCLEEYYDYLIKNNLLKK